MNTDSVRTARKELDGLLTAIRLCSAVPLPRPALRLLYAGIDIAGWLADAGNLSPTRDRDAFLAWVDRYLQPETFGVTAVELYGARCGLLHRGDGTSRLSEKGARTISYGHDAAQAELLNKIFSKGGLVDKKVAVSIPELVEAFERGIATFFEELKRDTERRASVNNRASTYFLDVDPDIAAKFLALLNEVEG